MKPVTFNVASMTLRQLCFAFVLLVSLSFGSQKAQAQAVDASLRVTTTEPLAVGTPFDYVLEVHHPSAIGVQLSATELELDDSWVVLSHAPIQVRLDPHASGRLISETHWKVASLEPGERELAGVSIDYTQSGVPKRKSVRAARVEVASVLAERETTHRPLAPFRDVKDLPPSPVVRTLQGLGLAILVGLLWGIWRLFASRRGVPELAPEATPAEVLASLSAKLTTASPSLSAREAHYEMTGQVRRAADSLARSVQVGAACTDGEWLERVRPAWERHLEASGAAELTSFFERCEAVKYGAQEPTRFAVEENLNLARALVEQVSGWQPEVTQSSETPRATKATGAPTPQELASK